MSDDWRDRAACLGCNPDLFFPRQGDNHGMNAALAVCAGCSVRDACLEANIWETQGVFGGTSAIMRKRIRRERGLIPPAPEIEHGTAAGYLQHRRRHESACAACKLGHAIAKHERKLRLINGDAA